MDQKVGRIKSDYLHANLCTDFHHYCKSYFSVLLVANMEDSYVKVQYFVHSAEGTLMEGYPNGCSPREAVQIRLYGLDRSGISLISKVISKHPGFCQPCLQTKIRHWTSHIDLRNLNADGRKHSSSQPIVRKQTLECHISYQIIWLTKRPYHSKSQCSNTV